MSGVDHVLRAAESNGWRVLHRTPHSVTVYRWLPGIVRHEVCCTFDDLGRIEAVSTWENRRTAIDQEPGRRARVEALLSTPRRPPPS